MELNIESLVPLHFYIRKYSPPEQYERRETNGMSVNTDFSLTEKQTVLEAEALRYNRSCVKFLRISIEASASLRTLANKIGSHASNLSN